MPPFRRVLALLLAVVFMSGGCAAADDAVDGGPIVIGSFDTTESNVLGEVYRLALTERAFPAVHRMRIGDRATVIAMLRAGEIDFVPEYVGASLEETFGIEPPADLAAAYAALTDRWFDEGFLTMLPAGAENRAAFAVRADTADALGIRSLTELAALADDLTFGSPEGCADAPDCLPGLTDEYGAVFGRIVEIGSDEVVGALESGDIDVGPISTSDPAVDDAGLVVLEDDRRLVPAQSIVPIVSIDASIRLGDEMLTVVDSVSAVLEQRALIQLNRLVGSGRAPEDAASEWLLVNGLAE
jgi:osmoprotectant transport system substrate-binding protein